MMNSTSGQSPVARELIIEAIHGQTKVPKKVLRDQLAAAAQGLGSAVQDKAHHLARRALDKRFAGGAHLMFCSDDRFYAYDGRLWSPIKVAVLGQLLQQEAANSFPSSPNLLALVNNAKGLLANMLAKVDDLFSVSEHVAFYQRVFGYAQWCEPTILRQDKARTAISRKLDGRTGGPFGYLQIAT
jgi:hypothetical protein